MRVFSRSMAETPNRFSVEFQDALNEYQQDSFSLVDRGRCGAERAGGRGDAERDRDSEFRPGGADI